MTFLEQARAGVVTVDDVEDFVSRWHDGEGSGTLRDFLGLTSEEYGLWLREPSALERIVSAGKDLPRWRKAAG